MKAKEEGNKVESKSTSRKKGSSDYVAATVYIPKDTNDNLRLLSIEQGLSKSSYIMKALNEQIKRDSFNGEEHKNSLEIKKLFQELEALNTNVNYMIVNFNLLKSAVIKAINQL